MMLRTDYIVNWWVLRYARKCVSVWDLLVGISIQNFLFEYFQLVLHLWIYVSLIICYHSSWHRVCDLISIFGVLGLNVDLCMTLLNRRIRYWTLLILKIQLLGLVMLWSFSLLSWNYFWLWLLRLRFICYVVVIVYCWWLRMIALLLLISRHIVLGSRNLKDILDEILVLLVLLWVEIWLLATFLHRLCWCMKNWYNNLLGLTSIKSVVLIDISRLNIAS